MVGSIGFDDGVPSAFFCPGFWFFAGSPCFAFVASFAASSDDGPLPGGVIGVTVHELGSSGSLKLI